MKITSLTIGGFKGIARKTTIPLAPITLLFGANSTGKSTVLHAFLYLYEVIANRNYDAQFSSITGESLYFGGFQNLVHGKSESGVITLGASIDFGEGKKLHRQALEIQDLGHGFDGETLFTGGNLLLEAGTRLAVIGENGVGKTTLLKCLVQELEQNQGIVKWSENASVGYCPQDSTADFDNDLSIFDWISQWRTVKHDDLMVRGILGRLLFTADDANKKARNCSGGEKNRLLFGKLMMQDINVLVMDEPTNHMDMEAIQALNDALKVYTGTLIFVSHDREFVSSLATHIIDVKDQQLISFQGTYEEYLDHQKKMLMVAL